jgi:uncharacterized protein YlxW (UPF0749 family)
MTRPPAGQDWLRLVLEADGLSDYRDTSHHHHRVDWVGRTLSALSMGAVGFLVVAAGIGIAQSRPMVTAEQDELRARVIAEQQRNAAVESSYLAARADLKQTQEAVRPDLDGALAAALDAQSVAAAFVAMRGPGVILVLSDSKQPTFSGTTDLGRIIDRDVQHAVNGLWAAGAEAISIDGVRLTARTSIRNAGTAVLVDYQPVSSPIEIRALGSARTLSNRFRAHPAWDELVALRDRYGIRWSFTTHSRISVPAGTSTLPTMARAEGDQ